MKIKLVIILAVIVAVAAIALIGYNFDHWLFSSFLEKFSFEIPLLSFAIVAVVVFLLVLMLKCLEKPKKSERILRFSIFGVAVLVILFLNSISLSLGKAVADVPFLHHYSSCLTQADILQVDSLVISACSKMDHFIATVIPLLVGILAAILLGFLITKAHQNFLHGAAGSRVVLFIESLIWLSVVEGLIYTYMHDMALIFVNAFTYTIAAYFLITTDLVADAKEVLKSADNNGSDEKPTEPESEEDEPLSSPPRF